MMPVRLVLVLVTLIACWGCGDGDLTPEESLDKSCGGEVIPNCRPYEYAIVREGSVTPEEVEVGDPLARLDVRIVFDGCGSDAPSAHSLAVNALDEMGGRDGGTSGSMVTLATFRDGSPDDTNPAEGVFEGNVENFFLTGIVREEADLVLSFEPRIDVCRGGVVELPYRTGPAYEMTGP